MGNRNSSGRSEDHGARGTLQLRGAYGAWLTTGDMVDYVILNFRLNRPRKERAGNSNLQTILRYCR
jgi:hypothetical protein